MNDRYLDKNYGGILILWDRLFGSFPDEDDGEPCVYGTRSPLNSWDPLWANAEVYTALLHDSWHARRWGDKLRVWFKPPGWRPADVAARFPKPALRPRSRCNTYAPPMSRARAALRRAQFTALLAGVGASCGSPTAGRCGKAGSGLRCLLAGLWAWAR